MADYHFVYKDVEGASTQWDDIQRRLGNLPPKPAPFKPAPFLPPTTRISTQIQVLDRREDSGMWNPTGLLGRAGEKVSCNEVCEDNFNGLHPNYPDRNLPTVLVYNNSAVKATYLGLHQFGLRKCTPEAVALALCQSDQFLLDGPSGGDTSREAVIDGVRKKFHRRLGR
ncbi:hypothetical protein J5N97_013371 [Dioscorea zingiberensis]|uniref:Uncharacterized protein n=1 Tax=Dioscorea zingiberensis TaxID=325984 RepID=A0A9D5HIZ5_9LILI|nr:hypothetical protein J5N97_013371 [Dioscorea zingiberensis]